MPNATTKRVSLDAQTGCEQEIAAALNELNLAVKMLDLHVLTPEQRHTMQHLHLKHMQIIAARVLNKYDLC